MFIDFSFMSVLLFFLCSGKRSLCIIICKLSKMSKVFFWSLLQITCHKARTRVFTARGNSRTDFQSSQKNWDHIGFKQDTYTKPQFIIFFTIFFSFWGVGVGKAMKCQQREMDKRVDPMTLWVSPLCQPSHSSPSSATASQASNMDLENIQQAMLYSPQKGW